jgi:nanoRNase/pAp phosphatase (c-di-AMP/oligoRNAs hydrolase)
VIRRKKKTREIEPLGTTAPGTPFDLGRALAGVRGRRAVGIYMHDNPDPDSIAAALGLSRLLEVETGAAVTLALGGIVGRAENRAMVNELAIVLAPLETLDPQSFDCLAIVDSQPGTGNNSLPDTRPVDIIIDHHGARPQSQSAWCDVRPDFGATSTIVFEYLRARGIPLDARLATALFYALRTETRDLGREAGEAERLAYLHLVPLVDHNALDRISHPKVPKEHFRAADRAMRSARVYGDVVAATLDDLSYPDLVAEMADSLLAYEGAKFSLCIGRYRRRVHVSLRTDVDFDRAGSLMRQIIDTDGAAGGHGTMAGGSLFREASTPAELEAVADRLIRRLETALGRMPATPVPLME